MKNLLAILASLISLSLSAQTTQQKGVVRMITNSADSPVKPVGGVKVVVGNNVSKTTGMDGAFSVQVTSKFQVNGVTGGDYILALPTKGKDYFASKNDLDVVVTTKGKKDEDYKRLYSAIQKKYNQRAKEVLEMKRKCQSLLDEMDSSDKRFASTKHQRDSLQSLYLEYFNHEDAVEKEMRRIAEELALTDYLSLDTLNRRIYELKCLGEWQSISDLIQTVIGGDLADYISEAVAEKQRTEAQLQQARQQAEAADRDLAARFHFVEEAIEALKMQHLNDSVSKMYKILTDAAPDNWAYLNEAGLFESYYTANYAKALYYHQRAIGTNPADTLLAVSHNNIGYVHNQQGNYAEAIEQYEKGLMAQIPVFGDMHPIIALGYNNIGEAYSKQGDYAKALESLAKAVAIQLPTLGDNSQHVATSYNNIGLVYFNLGNYDEALKYYDEALKICIVAFGESHPKVATIYNNIGNVYQMQEKYNEAIAQCEKALKIQLAALGDNHPDVATNYNNIAEAYRKVGNDAKALELHYKALAIRLSVFGDSNPELTSSYNNLGELYRGQGNNDKAMEMYTKALNIAQSAYGDKHIDVATIYNNMGLVYYNQTKYTEALTMYKRSLHVLLSIFGENHSNLITLHNNLGELYLKQEDYNNALKHYTKALQLIQSKDTGPSLDIAACKMAITICLHSMGRNKEALPYAQKSLQTYRDLFGVQNAVVAQSAELCGIIYQSLGDFPHAAEHIQMTINIRIALNGEDNAEVMRDYTLLAGAYQQMGDWDKMAECLTRSANIMSKQMGEDNPSVQQLRQAVENIKKLKNQ